MPARSPPESSLPAVVSVTEMARRVGLSRSRFYELVRSGHLPTPVYCLRTRRPMYLTEQMVECLRVKQSGIGVNGGYVLFYSPRERETPSSPRPNRGSRTLPPPNQAEILEGLRALGMTAGSEEVAAAVRACFPDGTEGRDEGEVLRAVWQELRRTNAAR